MTFVKEFGNYLLVFRAWKSKDASLLITEMQNHYNHLKSLYQDAISRDESIKESLKNELQQERMLIREHLSKLGKNAGELIDGLDYDSLDVDATISAQNNSHKEIEQSLKGVSSLSELGDAELVHELVLDPDFKLKCELDNPSLTSDIRRIAVQVFFDEMRKDFSSNDKAAISKWIPGLVQDLQKVYSIPAKNRNLDKFCLKREISNNKSSAFLIKP